MTVKLVTQQTKTNKRTLTHQDVNVQQFIRYARCAIKLWDALEACEDAGIRDTSKLDIKTAQFQETIANYGKKFLTKKLFGYLSCMKPFGKFDEWKEFGE